jgi:hypothetical protein
MEKTAVQSQSQVVDSGIVVGGIQAAKPRRMSMQAIADDIATRITGVTLEGEDVYDPKTGKFFPESELKAKGAVFVTIAYRSGARMNKTSRIDKNPNPFLGAVKTSKYQVLANVKWQDYVNRRSNHGKFEANEKPSNGVENYRGCLGVGKHSNGSFQVKGVPFRVVEDAKYWDTNGNEIDSDIIDPYLKKQSKASKEKEAAKHGISVKNDPIYRGTRIDSCEYIRVFGFEYIPTE